MDIVAAFAVLLRRIIFTDVDSDEAWLKRLSHNCFSPEDIKIIYDAGSDHSWIQEGAPEHKDRFLLNLLNSFYKNTWFSQESIPCVVLTSCGSMAGIPPADIVYAMAFSRVMRRFQDTVSSESLESKIVFPSGQTHRISEVNYCDDSALPVIEEAGGIVEKLILWSLLLPLC